MRDIFKGKKEEVIQQPWKHWKSQSNNNKAKKEKFLCIHVNVSFL